MAADRVLSAVGKLLIAALFWWSGALDILPTWPDVVRYVAAAGVPWPLPAAVGATALELLAPLALFPRRTEPWAAAALALYCLLTAVLFHDYWTSTGEERTAQLIHFLKNGALAGALLLIAARRSRTAPGGSA